MEWVVLKALSPYTGVILSGYKLRIFVTCCPRTYGGYSFKVHCTKDTSDCSPNTRGLFRATVSSRLQRHVFSVLTGVILSLYLFYKEQVGFLRTYGGYSISNAINRGIRKLSPYSRGLFYCRRSFNCTGIIFSVPTEVIRRVPEFPVLAPYFLRTYGGYSHIGLLIIDDIQLSSYTRGVIRYFILG